MKYLVKRILEPEFGCKERQVGYVTMDEAQLRCTDGSEFSMKSEDKELYQRR